jgi:beta-phosphoglucomutase-like phosphatase (HAD superfamily)
VAVYDTVIFDVDGTLVDTNYHHALAWFRAFRRHDLTVPVWRLHRAIGMGGDHVVPAVAGDDVEERLGEQLRADWSDEFDALLGEVQPFDGVRELLDDVRRRGFTLVLASSGKAEHVDHYLSLFGGAELAEAWTTSADVEQTKPAPDLLQAALEKVAVPRCWSVTRCGTSGPARGWGCPATGCSPAASPPANCARPEPPRSSNRPRSCTNTSTMCADN